jgi:hypothetical protein
MSEVEAVLVVPDAVLDAVPVAEFVDSAVAVCVAAVAVAIAVVALVPLPDGEPVAELVPKAVNEVVET